MDSRNLPLFQFHLSARGLYAKRFIARDWVARLRHCGAEPVTPTRSADFREARVGSMHGRSSRTKNANGYGQYCGNPNQSLNRESCDETGPKRKSTCERPVTEMTPRGEVHRVAHAAVTVISGRLRSQLESFPRNAPRYVMRTTGAIKTETRCHSLRVNRTGHPLSEQYPSKERLGCFLPVHQVEIREKQSRRCKNSRCQGRLCEGFSVVYWNEAASRTDSYHRC